eukprot:1103477-Pelagomonas_calceolata.AAC.2
MPGFCLWPAAASLVYPKVRLTLCSAVSYWTWLSLVGKLNVLTLLVDPACFWTCGGHTIFGPVYENETRERAWQFRPVDPLETCHVHTNDALKGNEWWPYFLKPAHPQPLHPIGTNLALQCYWRYKLPEHMLRFV